MKAQFNDFVPGRILYSVFCVDGLHAKEPAFQASVNKVIVVKLPKPKILFNQEYWFLTL